MKEPFKDGHPSYGTVVFSRWQGSAHRLFASAMRVNSGVSLTVCRARVGYDLGREWIHGSGEELIRIDLTNTQFADLLTEMNQGAGVPCTIRRYNGEGIEDPPADALTEHEKVAAELGGKAKEVGAHLNKMAAEIKVLLAKPNLGKKDREEIERKLDFFVQDVRSNLPWFITCVKEAAEKVVTQARHEIVAFTEGVLRRAGMEHLKKDAPALVAFETSVEKRERD